MTGKRSFFIEILSILKGGVIIFYTQKRSGFILGRGFGFIHIYHGQGVGKTTRAVGLAVRAAGDSRKVDFVQFMKSGTSSEVPVLKKIENIRYFCPAKHPFIMSHGPEAIHYEHAAKALHFALGALERGTQLLICDEILDTLIFGLLRKEQILELMKGCKNKV